MVNIQQGPWGQVGYNQFWFELQKQPQSDVTPQRQNGMTPWYRYWESVEVEPSRIQAVSQSKFAAVK